MKKLIPYAIIVILLALFINQYNGRKLEKSNYKSNELALRDSVKYHKNKYGKEVASKLALQLSLNELKDYSKENKQLKEAIKKFKKPITVIKTEQVVKIDTIVKFKDSIKYVFRKDIFVNDKHYQFNVKVDNLGFKISEMKLFNRQDIVVGWKRQGLFKNPIATAEITNSNKYFKQTNIKPFIIVYKKKWHEKWYVTIPSAFILGYALK